MDYKEAKDIRKKSFGTLLAEQEGGFGTSLKNALSQKSQARMTGIKETFDPMNIAKKLTFGSNWAPAMLGKLTNRDDKAMQYFAGAKAKKEPKLKMESGEGSFLDVLGLIYRELKKQQDYNTLKNEKEHAGKEKENQDEEDRNQDIIEALTGRRKEPVPAVFKPNPARTSNETPKGETGGAPKGGGKSTEPTTTPQKGGILNKIASVVTPGAVSTAAKVIGGGAIIGGTMTSSIGAAESGGNYNITYGDSLDKQGNVIHGRNMSPEQRFGKKLTELTLEEVNILGKERNSVSPSTSAMGKYQFMNSTLFGRKDKNGVFQPGLVQQAGDNPKTTKFDEKTQEKYYKMLHEQDIASLKRLGVPITPGYEYMAHYLGAGGAAAVYKNKNTNLTVQQALVGSGLPDPVKGKTNAELATLKASEFESVLEGRLNKHGLKPHASPTVGNVKTGEKLNGASKENGDLKKDSKTNESAPIVNSNSTNVSQTTNKTINQTDRPDDRPAHLVKAKQ